MSERKNKTVTTPSNHIVEIKEYISAGEFLDEWAAVAMSGGAAASEVPKARLGNFPRMPR